MRVTVRKITLSVLVMAEYRSLNAVNINFLRSNQSETRLNRNLHGDSPTPPHPQKRRQPLPEQAPKDASDDPGGPAAIQAILNSPAYREADQDIDFLQEEESRGLRLQLEYLKVDTVLQETRCSPTPSSCLAAPASLSPRPPAGN